MSPEFDDIAAFWDLYFRNQFVRLERGAAGYRAVTNAEPAAAAPPAGLFRERKLKAIEITFDRLRQWDYAGDPRFARIRERPAADYAAALKLVIEQSYPYRDPGPFGKERMAELAIGLRKELEHGGTPEQLLLKKISEHTPAQDQPLAVLAWLIGERRDRASAPALLEVVRNSPDFPFAAHRLHFTPVAAAFSGLWKINNKEVTPELLAMMENASDSGKRKIGALMERLYSTKELLSYDKCEEGYFDPGFWRKVIPEGRSLAEWDRADANALFWEIRYLAAERLPAEDRTTLEKLAADEVGTVGEAAKARLQNKA